MSLLALSCKLFGRRFTALWLHPVVAYFLLTGRAARDASKNYFEHLRTSEPRGDTPRPGWLSAYRHMLAFAQSGFDKLAAWTGRVDDSDVRFDDPTVSRRHALIHRDAAGARVLDDRSLNGVYLNGEKVDWHELEDGAQITIGAFTLYFMSVRDRAQSSASSLKLAPGA